MAEKYKPIRAFNGAKQIGAFVVLKDGQHVATVHISVTKRVRTDLYIGDALVHQGSESAESDVDSVSLALNGAESNFQNVPAGSFAAQGFDRALQRAGYVVIPAV
ncbi:MAG: hypothetical protein BV459_01840 [Thermoplasmata archaeon M11B2D]|nr:MAG: hypothetical protein BV459_01840 [Thermoplasmata archaeon M11B2D]